ncbi:hypothetical protein HZS_3744 [Henneguya salminicola]|nr:hypothetical protein HZS_3744 [Henneguya salminicola]
MLNLHSYDKMKPKFTAEETAATIEKKNIHTHKKLIATQEIKIKFGWIKIARFLYRLFLNKVLAFLNPRSNHFYRNLHSS